VSGDVEDEGSPMLLASPTTFDAMLDVPVGLFQIIRAVMLVEVDSSGCRW
jgi:hypothetical protein